jgi:hypothetical protein
MPLNNLMIMVALAPYTIGGAHPAQHGLVAFSLNGALVYALVLLAWYLAQAILERLYLWGLVMIPLVGALLVAANLYYHATFTLDPAARSWYAPAPLPANPLLWIAVLSFIQAASHASEARLPPRVTASGRWKTVREFVGGGPRLIRVVRLIAQALYGTVDELWAAPRLFPYGVLAQMWRHGYAPERFSAIDAVTRRAIASGDPALDFIGTGGGAFLEVKEPAAGEVSPAWRALFLVEVPLTLATCVYWVVAGGSHLTAMYGAASAPALALLTQLTGVVFSLVVWFYGRWLLSSRPVELRPFRYLQEGFALGDVFLVLAALDALRRGLGGPAVWIAQAAMAGLWLAVRVVFLVRTARPD